MKKNYSLILIAFLCFVLSGYGQIATQSFEASGDTWNYSSNQGDPILGYDLGSDEWHITTNQGGNTPSEGSNLWGFQDILNGTYSGDHILEFNSINVSAYTAITISFDWFADAFNATDRISYEINLDGSGWTNTDLCIGCGSTQTSGALSTTEVINVPNGTNTVQLRLIGNQNGGSQHGGFDNVVLDGTSACTDAVDFANIQAPTTTQTITIGGNFDVFAQVYELGVTEVPLNQGAGINAWIGYSATNNNPSNTGWTWIPATYNNVLSGNNDEYQAEIGTSITVPGTYYFASRFELNGCSSGYVYGGSGGNWNNDSVQLNVLADQVDFCNVDFPKAATINTGDNHDVYAQAYEPGVTDAVGQGANIEAWIGYTTNGINYQPWQATGWTWIAATYDSDANGVQNDQYVAEIGSSLPAGTYYYASRFRLNGSDYSYGGIAADNVGNFWDATNNNGTLVITDPPPADVVITEIMYNPPAADDYEWIEICNLNATAEDISNYTVEVNGTTRFTFPASTSIPANSCITVLLGHLTSSPAPECPFTPDYSNTIGNTNFLFNGGATITLESPSSAIADSVFYDDADSNATDGNGSSFHVIDANLDNSNTDTNWQAVSDGGSPGVNTLVSPCSIVELQLVDDSNVDQACGYTIDFGLSAIGFDTDVTFDIDNDGSLDLDVSSLVISGVDAADFTIVSPATPFTVTSGNTQTVTVRFNTATIGIKNAILTINNNDLDESACIVNLTGEGVSPSPNIIVRGLIGSNPTIPNGSTTASGLNNTLYAAQDINDVPVQTKSFSIINEGGTDVLNINSITLSGVGAPDFSVTANLTNPATNPIAINGNLDFTITFDPVTDSGTRVATVTIANSDPNKDPYTFIVQGTANCPSVSGSIAPTSGPAGTTVTVSSPGNSFIGFLSAELNGVPLNLISASATELVVRLPNTITTGGPLSIQLSNGCIFSSTFTLTDTTIAGCETSTSGTVGNLFISEVTDSPSGSLTYVELYNATGATINFATTNYSVILYNNGNTSSPKTLLLDSGTVANNSTYVISFGVTTGTQCTVAGGDGSLAQVDQPLPGASINFFRRVSGVDNPNLGHDFIGLYDPAAVTSMASDGLIDAWGTLGDETWASGLGLGTKGANFQRDSASMIPNSNTVFDASAWIITDWNDTDCSDTDYSTIGAYDFSTGVPPTVTLQPIDPVFACAFSASLTIAGTEGFNGPTPADTQELAYQWYFSAPGDVTWTEILPANTNYTGEQSPTLNITDTANLDGYQYYCQLREDSSTCFEASNAVLLTILKSVWDGTSWSELPAIDRIAIIDGDYDTSVGGAQTSFSACSLIINNSILNIDDGDFVEVENDLTVNGVNGAIEIEPEGSFVQIDDAGSVSAITPTNLKVSKLTAPSNNWYEYTYWSSPVFQETVANFFALAHPWRRYEYNAQNYRDSTYETNNGDIPTNGAGIDDVDDQAPYDWVAISTPFLEPGRGYASTHDSATFAGLPGCPGPACRVRYTFSGLFNNGIVTVPLYRNDTELNDNNWNFIGNPYPSAISADVFLATNTGIIDETIPELNPIVEGAIYLWSQNTPPSDTTNGNEDLNFSDSDYAIINGTGQTAAQSNGGDSTIPSRYIPSGQGFFIAMNDAAPSTQVLPTPIPGENIQTANVIFNNAMRVTGNNDQFFRSASQTNVDNKLWVNLTTDNGIFSQILVGYLDNATDNYDGMYYDAPKNASTEVNSIIYTLIPNEAKKFAIQGKNSNSLGTEEIIPLGFYTAIDVATIYTFTLEQFEGQFLTNNPIYVKDNLLNLIHNLKDSDYAFTSETGEFNSRFEIVFTPSALSIDDNLLGENDLTITELPNGEVQFTVSKKFSITNVVILDILGRAVYNLQGNNSTEVYDLSKLSNSAYIAKVTLSNEQVISKKAIKRL